MYNDKRGNHSHVRSFEGEMMGHVTIRDIRELDEDYFNDQPAGTQAVLLVQNAALGGVLEGITNVFLKFQYETDGDKVYLLDVRTSSITAEEIVGVLNRMFMVHDFAIIDSLKRKARSR